MVEYQKPMIDPATGAVNEDVAIRFQKECLLQKRIQAGADGGNGDNPGGPCQESFRNLSNELYPVGGMTQAQRDFYNPPSSKPRDY